VWPITWAGWEQPFSGCKGNEGWISEGPDGLTRENPGENRKNQPGTKPGKKKTYVMGQGKSPNARKRGGKRSSAKGQGNMSVRQQGP